VRSQSSASARSALRSRARRALALSALLALAGNLIANPARAQSVERVLVDGRKMQGVRFEAAPWSAGRTWIEGSGAGNGIFAADLVSAGDFTLRATLVLVKREATDAAVQLGASRFGLDGANKSLFVDGPLFGGKLSLIDDTGRSIQSGKPFELEIGRAGGTLSVSIDKKKVWQGEVEYSEALRAGIVPNRATIEIQRWSISGAFETPPPRPHENIQPAIDAALDKAIAWLLSQQQRDGSWNYLEEGFLGGQTALSVYTLLRAGLPKDHPAIQRGLAFIDEVTPITTYSASTMIMAYEATGDPGRKERIRALLERLISWERQGAWGYPNEPAKEFTAWANHVNRPDLSNTKYAVLALRSAHYAGVDVPPKLWTEILGKVLALQEDVATVDVPTDGVKTGVATLPIAGFRYAPDRDAGSGMTTAGVALVRICKDMLGKRIGDRLANESARSIEVGMNWLSYYFNLDQVKNGEAFFKYDQLYGFERVGTLLEIDKIGDHDWYREGAEWLFKKVEKDGHWFAAEIGSSPWTKTWDQPDTCFAILFLKRASRPTVTTGEPLSRRLTKPPDDPSELVRLRGSGTTTITAWIDGFSARALAESGAEPPRAKADTGAKAGLRVAYVEYSADGTVVRRRDGDPSKAWEGEPFTVQYTFTQAGRHRLGARVHLVAPDAPPDSKEATSVLEAKDLEVESDGIFEPWMREAAQARRRSLLLGADLKVSASSQKSNEEAGAEACDGLQGSRWLCAANDAAPVLTVEIGKPVRADTIVLSPACSQPSLRGMYDEIRQVTVRINHEVAQHTIALDPDELKPTVFALPKTATIGRLEIHITDREPGKRQKGVAGFAEIALEKR
jgi:hypothetical protein